jgi:hypothetical protein
MSVSEEILLIVLDTEGWTAQWYMDLPGHDIKYTLRDALRTMDCCGIVSLRQTTERSLLHRKHRIFGMIIPRPNELGRCLYKRTCTFAGHFVYIVPPPPQKKVPF